MADRATTNTTMQRVSAQLATLDRIAKLSTPVRTTFTVNMAETATTTTVMQRVSVELATLGIIVKVS
ncbi:hypothetical protein DPMN_023237 [Dreissena polymorpha]|uniref:Uncharacterized protein n=1 Tax=Dreissena polymorpha TaxID=45954 RepID=A0A9D4R9Q4_DREPO|nr:hypothetical protein DPMN_023237 [Dreissena polymorpha]